MLDGRGRTALHHAAIRNQNAMAVHLTTVHNANVNILDGDRALPRDLADRRQEEVNELLDILGAEEPPGEERINPLHLLGSVALTAAVGQAGGHGHGGGAAVGGGCL